MSRGFAMDRNLTILVAEDTEDDALFLERGFRKAGLKNPLQILTDGEEVIKYFKAEGKYEDRAKYPFPSVFFTDIKMPKMSGIQLYEKVAAMKPAMRKRFIFITGDMNSLTSQQMSTVTDNPCLLKPVNIEELIAVATRAEPQLTRLFTDVIAQL